MTDTIVISDLVIRTDVIGTIPVKQWGEGNGQREDRHMPKKLGDREDTYLSITPRDRVSVAIASMQKFVIFNSLNKDVLVSFETLGSWFPPGLLRILPCGPRPCERPHTVD